MRNITLLLAAAAIMLLSASANLFGQDNGFKFELSGYVKTDIMYDTRENVSLREGHLLLYPS